MNDSGHRVNDGPSRHFLEARRLENLLDQKLINFSKFSTSFTHDTLLGEAANERGANNNSGDHVASSQAMSFEIQELLRELADVNERIAAALTDADRSHGTAQAHAQQHHRARLREYEKDFRTLRSNIEQAKAQAELLSTVRRDISAYKDSSSSGSSGSMQQQHMALQGASDELARVLSQAHNSRTALQHQRGIVEASFAKLKAAASALPQIHGLFARVRRRRMRDQLILAGVIVFFIFLLYAYSARKG